MMALVRSGSMRGSRANGTIFKNSGRQTVASCIEGTRATVGGAVLTQVREVLGRRGSLLL